MQAAGVGGRGCVVASWRPQAPDTASPGPAPHTAAPGRQQAPGGLHRPGPWPAPCCGGRTEVRGAAGLARCPCRLRGRRSAFRFPPLQRVTASFPPTSQGGRGHTPRMVTVPWWPPWSRPAGRPAPHSSGGPGGTWPSQLPASAPSLSPLHPCVAVSRGPRPQCPPGRFFESLIIKGLGAARPLCSAGRGFRAFLGWRAALRAILGSPQISPPPVNREFPSHVAEMG